MAQFSQYMTSKWKLFPRRFCWLLIVVYLMLTVKASEKVDKQLEDPSGEYNGLLRRRTNPEDPTKIVGGTMVSSSDKYPFFVQLLRRGCGGTMVWEDIVLTAAHCKQMALSAYRRDYAIVGGRIHGLGQERLVVREVEYPSYKPWTSRNDFAVLKLNEPVPFNDATGIYAVKVNTDFEKVVEAHPDKPLTVIGFGLQDEDARENSGVLREVDVDYVSHSKCQELYDVQDIILKESNQFCAGDIHHGGRDSCAGDSGGPILDENNTQVGIVSFGVGCARKKYPGVYAKVSYVADWIEEQICTISNNPPPRCFPELETGDTDEAANDGGEGDTNESGEAINDGGEDETNDEGNSDENDTDESDDLIIYDHVGNNSTNLTVICDFESVDDDISNTTTNSSSNHEGCYTELDHGLQIEIQYDAYPTETYWSLFETDTDTIVAATEPYSETSSSAKRIISFPFLSDGSYTFSIYDILGDGICCTFGEGWVRVTQFLMDEEYYSTGTTTNTFLIWYSDGNFGSEASVSFELSPISQITAAPTLSAPPSNSPVSPTAAPSMIVEESSSSSSLLGWIFGLF